MTEKVIRILGVKIVSCHVVWQSSDTSSIPLWPLTYEFRDNGTYSPFQCLRQSNRLLTGIAVTAGNSNLIKITSYSSFSCAARHKMLKRLQQCPKVATIPRSIVDEDRPSGELLDEWDVGEVERVDVDCTGTTNVKTRVHACQSSMYLWKDMKRSSLHCHSSVSICHDNKISQILQYCTSTGRHCIKCLH